MRKESQTHHKIYPFQPPENSHLGKSAEALSHEINRHFWALNINVRSGEEPYEIEVDVWSGANLVAAGLAQKAPFMPYDVIYGSVRSLLEYTYLYRWGQGVRSNIGRLPGAWITDFMTIITDNGKVFWPPFPLSLSQFYALFFRYLDECGVMEVKLDVLMNALRKFERIENQWRADNFREERGVVQ